ncbi:hypothetical protein GGR58DRAFT_472879 [Xylaria digitata]|nr:hypothetical protein GGR58DRAFT_472879 [Xylaria digitata]
MLIAAILMGLLALASAMPTLFNASELAVDANISWTGEGIIPVSAMGCREETVPVEEADQAKQKLAKWGGFQHIKPGSWHGEAYGYVTNSPFLTPSFHAAFFFTNTSVS